MYKVHEEGNGNKVIGTYPQLNNSTISFQGRNNILFCEDNVVLTGSSIKFRGDNSLIYLSSSRTVYRLAVTLFQSSVLHLGKDTYTNQLMTIILSEHKHCFIGDDSIFSTNVVIRNADPHLVYSCSTGERLNPSRSVYIGDHVWIGQDARILKGSQIDSGSIVGAGSIVTGKKIPHNTTWAGSPCKEVRKDIFWDISCVHQWTEERTEDSLQYAEYIKKYKIKNAPDAFIYNYSESESIPFSELEQRFSDKVSAMDKCDYLVELNSKKTKNRFVHS